MKKKIKVKHKNDQDISVINETKEVNGNVTPLILGKKFVQHCLNNIYIYIFIHSAIAEFDDPLPFSATSSSCPYR